jgi:hypothetical protein
MFKPFRREKNPTTFWDWLAANTSAIQDSTGRAIDPMREEVGRVFQSYYPDLVYEISLQKSGPRLFCVSADGDVKRFPRVIDVVNNAPAIEHWRIQAFRTRGSLDGVIDFGGSTLGYDDLWCEIEPARDGFDVCLFIRGLTPDPDRQLGGAALLLLDNALGEFDAAARIKALRRAPLPDRPQRSESFFPLAELPAMMDRTRTTKLN